MPFEPSGKEKTFCPYFVKIQHPFSRLERYIYYSIHIFTTFYLLYSTYNSSQEYKGQLLDLSKGDYFGSKKDNNDFEWKFWKKHLYAVGIFYVLYAILSILVQRLKNLTLRWVLMIAYTMVVWTYIIGIKALSIVCMQIGLSIFTSIFTGSKIMVWIVNGLSILMVNWSYSINWLFHISNNEVGYLMLVYILSINNLRCISVGIDLLSSERPALAVTLLRGYGYCCYFPLFVTGPHLPFLDFVRDIRQPFKPATFKEILCHVYCLLRLVFYFFFLEIVLHHMYMHTILRNLEIIKKMSLISIMGIGYASAYFFYIKYVDIYGFPKVCSWYDGVNVPRTPSCFMHIYKFSEVWRYFDRGLYEFIRRYIYIPLGGSRSGIVRQLLSSSVAFCFIFLWHGATVYLFVWSAMNFLVVAVEAGFLKISQTQLAANLKKNYLGPAWRRRIHIASFYPIIYISHVAIICFFVGDIQYILREYISRTSLHASIANQLKIFLCAYCAISTAFDINQYFPNCLK